jgi:predicted metal-dependent hydrolase
MRLRRGVFSRRRLVRDLAAYEEPNFHPDTREVEELLEHWRVELAAPLEEARSRARSA